MGYEERADDEHCVSAIVSLFKHLGQEGKLWQRVLSKFQENDYEKVERLVEMHVKYLGQVLDVEDSTDKKRQELEAEGIEIGEAEEADFYLDKLEAGLFTLQLVARIIATLCQADPKIKDTLAKLLAMQNLNVDSVKVVLRDYALTMGDDDADDDAEAQAEDSDAAKVKAERRKILDLAEQL
jgi:beta-catenin-like protein 1